MVTNQAAPNDNDLNVLLALSQDELAFLLGEMGITRLPEFQIPSGYTPAHGEAAARGLIARGLLRRRDDGSYEANPVLAAVVAAGAQSTRMLALTVGQANQERRYWYYLRPGFVVEHTCPQPGVQRFQTLDSGEKLAFVLAGLLALDVNDPTKPAEEPVTLEKALYDRARAQARAGQQQAAAQLLAGQGLPASLVQAIAAPPAYYIIAGFTGSQSTLQSTKVMLVLRAADGFWAVAAETETTMLAIPMTAEAVLSTTADLVR